MIPISDKLFYDLTEMTTTITTRDDPIEQKHQKKISDYLDKAKFITIKIVSANKTGWPDIFALDPYGQLWAIEVKRSRNGVVSRLQHTRLAMLKENKAVPMVAWGFEDFKTKYELLIGLRK